MNKTLLILPLLASVTACKTANTITSYNDAARGLEPVNVPVVARQDYALDVNAPDGSLSSAEVARLDGWFRGLSLGYGDSVFVDGDYSGLARADVARVAGQYGMLLSKGAPVTAGQVAPGMVRVVVSRASASVPNCPNWSRPAQPDFENQQMSNFGCGVNTNIAAMVANPQDLVSGRDGSGVSDTFVAGRALEYYRKAPPTGSQGLKDVNTKQRGQ